MLADAKAQRFIDDFVRQWLQLHRVGMFPPDKKLYPTYDAWLETSMRSEVIEYFRELFAKNLPVDAFIDSDWTMANARLCEFYKLPEPKAGGFQRGYSARHQNARQLQFRRQRFRGPVCFVVSLAPSGKAVIRKQYVHIGFAVDTPDGLLVRVPSGK